MRYLPLLLALLSLPAQAGISADFQSLDDKTKHFLAGLAVTSLAYTFTDLSIGQSFALGVSVGVLNEVRDSRVAGGFDMEDAFVTGIGAFVGGFAIQHIEGQKGVTLKYKFDF